MENIKENVTLDEVYKLDVRLGRILEAEAVPKRKKLLKLLVDFGHEKRTVISAIAESYDSQHVVGMLVPFVVNLAPVEIAGVVSQAMVIGSDSPLKGNLRLLEGGGVAGDIVL
jgi:methionyl-tRNA synthetase